MTLMARNNRQMTSHYEVVSRKGNLLDFGVLSFFAQFGNVSWENTVRQG